MKTQSYLEHNNITVNNLEEAVKFIQTAMPEYEIRGEAEPAFGIVVYHAFSLFVFWRIFIIQLAAPMHHLCNCPSLSATYKTRGICG